MNRAALVLIAATLTVAACSGRPSTPEEARTITDGSLCLGLRGALDDPVVVDEVNRRALLTEAEWLLIRQGLINIGVSQCAVQAAFGPPHRINSRTFGETVMERWIYDDNHYVYIRNGKVASFAFVPPETDPVAEEEPGQDS